MMEGLRAGRRTIGEVAGHEINLEIEGVQDNKKVSYHFNTPDSNVVEKRIIGKCVLQT